MASKKKKALVALSQVQGLRQFIVTSTEEGVLVQKGGVEALYKQVREKYKDDLAEAKLDMTLAQFTKLVKDVVWNKKTHESLCGFLRHAHDVEAAIARWHESYATIPLEWVKEQAKWVRGVSSAVAPVAMVPGLGGYLETGWLKDIPDVQLPKSSFAKPFKITLNSKSACQFAVFNGANLGLIYNPLIDENPLRQKLSEAESNGVDVVFLTNVFALEVIKAAGALMVYRARLAGLNTKIEILDPDYQEEARRIEKELPDDEVIFEAPIERVVNVFSGLHKIQTKPDGKPEFSGKIYMLLGYSDELLINTLTYWVLNYLRILRQQRLKGEIDLTRREMGQAYKKGNFEGYAECEVELRRLVKLHTRSATSSIRAQDVNRFAPKLRSLFLTKLKELVPNMEVIGLGSTYVQLNDKPVVELRIPGHRRVTDTLLSAFAASCGPKIIRKQIAQTTIICHPYALQARDTVREADRDGKRHSVQVFVAPILVDDQYLKEELGDVVRSVHPIQRAIFHDQFKPGALRFRYHGSGNVVAQDFWPITKPLPAIHLKRKGSRSSEAPRYPNFGKAPYIWYAIATDPHLGGKARQTVWCEERGEALGMFESVVHSMRKEGYLGGSKFGIHMWSCNDDPTQGHNYNTERQPHPQLVPNIALEQVSRDFQLRLMNASGPDRLAIFNEYRQFMHLQIDMRGLDWVQHQIEEVFDRFIEPNVDYFSAVLAKAKQSGLIVKPVSEHYGLSYDQRDLGILNWGSGNHFAHSIDDMLTEGFLYARSLQDKLLQRKEWSKDPAFIRKFVRAPLYSNFFCGWGTIRVGSGYEWGMDLRPSPTRMSSWGDTVAGAVRNDVLRGNPTRIMEGRVRIQTYGDKHFFGTAVTPDVIFHMCASGTHTDRYGEHGFPPNNTGVSFIGIPVEGPELPMLFRYLRYDQITELLKPGVHFDWESFLPNPV